MNRNYNKKINVDVRIISASNKNLSESIQKGLLREDLFYRLSVVPIEVPPLYKRGEDIIDLINHFLNVNLVFLMPLSHHFLLFYHLLTLKSFVHQLYVLE